ncbi:MAG: hypothetical protein RL065_1868, partial [Bacteroidota bacterium]
YPQNCRWVVSFEQTIIEVKKEKGKKVFSIKAVTKV